MVVEEAEVAAFDGRPADGHLADCRLAEGYDKLHGRSLYAPDPSVIASPRPYDRPQRV